MARHAQLAQIDTIPRTKSNPTGLREKALEGPIISFFLGLILCPEQDVRWLLLNHSRKINKVVRASVKLLGQAINGEPQQGAVPVTGKIFAWLDARTPMQKIAWSGVLVVFVLHYLLAFRFEFQWIGEATIWISLVTGILMVLVLGVYGGRDVISLIRSFIEEPKPTPQEEGQASAEAKS